MSLNASPALKIWSRYNLEILLNRSNWSYKLLKYNHIVYKVQFSFNRNKNQLAIFSAHRIELGTDLALFTLESVPFPSLQNKHMELCFKARDLVTELQILRCRKLQENQKTWPRIFINGSLSVSSEMVLQFMAIIPQKLSFANSLSLHWD